jgi:hypothetical protein
MSTTLVCYIEHGANSLEVPLRYGANDLRLCHFFELAGWQAQMAEYLEQAREWARSNSYHANEVRRLKFAARLAESVGGKLSFYVR